MENKITVFTPTYNRAYCLIKLYESLLKQKYTNFEWIIVDDGSIDNTKEIVNSWINESKIDIKYIYQANSGKQMAYNKGIQNAQGELFICIDSDDYYLKDAFEFINIQWNLIKNNKKFAGMGFLSSYDNGNIIGSEFPKQIIDCSHLDIYTKYKVTGDKGLAFRTSILKQFKFPKIENEKFINEALLYNRISNQYIMRYINKVIEIKEYQRDGLTSNFNKVLLDNPKGMILYLNELTVSKVRFRSKFKAAIEYIQWNKYINKSLKDIIFEAYSPVLVIFAYPLLFLKKVDYLN